MILSTLITPALLGPEPQLPKLFLFRRVAERRHLIHKARYLHREHILGAPYIKALKETAFTSRISGTRLSLSPEGLYRFVDPLWIACLVRNPIVGIKNPKTLNPKTQNPEPQNPEPAEPQNPKTQKP